MRKRRRLLIFMAGVALMILLAWAFLRVPSDEPVYKGKPLSQWLVQFTDSDNDTEREEAKFAINEIGTNAVPTLLRMLRTEESPLKTRLLAVRYWRQFFKIHIFNEWPIGIRQRADAGFAILGPRGVSAVPELVKMLDADQSAKSLRNMALVLRDIGVDGRAVAASLTNAVPALDNILDRDHSRQALRDAANILKYIGPDAKAAVPALLRVSTNANTDEHFYEFDALARIHAYPELVVPVLIDVIRNNPRDRMSALMVIGEFGNDARAVVPDLVRLLNDPTMDTRTTGPNGTGSGFVSKHEEVERALKKIDPETYARVVTHKTVLK